jgi:DnaJ-domain-containing protein 1
MSRGDGLLDRLAELLRSFMGDEKPAGPRAGPSGSPRFVDPDLKDAWEELDQFMGGGKPSAGSGAGSAGGRQERASPARPTDDRLRSDYANLEVPYDSDIEAVKASYKRLVIKYHPDKHAADPERQKIALEIMKKINQSFERIRSRHEGGA